MQKSSALVGIHIPPRKLASGLELLSQFSRTILQYYGTQLVATKRLMTGKANSTSKNLKRRNEGEGLIRQLNCSGL